MKWAYLFDKFVQPANIYKFTHFSKSISTFCIALKLVCSHVMYGPHTQFALATASMCFPSGM